MGAIVGAIFGSSVLSVLISEIFGYIKWKQGAKEKPIEERFTALDAKLEKAEKDSVRTQLLLLISDYPESKEEIQEVARHYFQDIKGDWYMTSLFNKWLESTGSGKPEWFDSRK